MADDCRARSHITVERLKRKLGARASLESCFSEHMARRWLSHLLMKVAQAES